MAVKDEFVKAKLTAAIEATAKTPGLGAGESRSLLEAPTKGTLLPDIVTRPAETVVWPSSPYSSRIFTLFD